MEENKPDTKWIETVSHWMDSRFILPGTQIRFGLDPLIGLVPFAGEVTTFIISSALVLYMARYGASRKVVILMILNVLLDAFIGSIPVIGNIFDFTFRANQKNIRLLQKHYQEGKYQGSGSGIVLLVVVILIIAFALFVYALFKLTQIIFEELSAIF